MFSRIRALSVLNGFLVLVVLVHVAVASALGQSSSGEYEKGTIMAVVRHPEAAGDVARYDVSLKIRNTMYMVLYTPPNGANSVEYAAGIDMLFLVGKDSVTFNSKITGTTTMPILRTESLPEEPVLDWSKAPGEYFSMKLQHLSEGLDLSSDQRSRIKPIIEQEAGEAAQVCFTSTISVQDRLNRCEMIVHSSDEKMKSVLSQAQWQKLQEIRKEQKQELKQLITKRKS